jgi:hypothetical protein
VISSATDVAPAYVPRVSPTVMPAVTGWADSRRHPDAGGEQGKVIDLSFLASLRTLSAAGIASAGHQSQSSSKKIYRKAPKIE